MRSIYTPTLAPVAKVGVYIYRAISRLLYCICNSSLLQLRQNEAEVD